MEKCINKKCEFYGLNSNDNCGSMVPKIHCGKAIIEEYSVISVDELTRMREKLDRQDKFIDYLILCYSNAPGNIKTREVLEKQFKEISND